MKRRLIIACMAAIGACPSAYAGNTALEAAISHRSELSSFYKALQETGVLGELQEGVSYTVLAPTNSAFAARQRKSYPCLDTVQCKDEVAAILRGHIIAGAKYIGYSGAGKNALFSISQHYIPVGQPSRNVYEVDGQRIMDVVKHTGGMVYTIDGVIVPRFAKPNFAQDEERVTTVTKKTIPNPACGPEGCPDSYSKTTIITRHVPDVAPAAGE